MENEANQSRYTFLMVLCTRLLTILVVVEGDVRGTLEKISIFLNTLIIIEGKIEITQNIDATYNKL